MLYDQDIHVSAPMPHRTRTRERTDENESDGTAKVRSQCSTVMRRMTACAGVDYRCGDGRWIVIVKPARGEFRGVAVLPKGDLPGCFRPSNKHGGQLEKEDA